MDGLREGEDASHLADINDQNVEYGEFLHKKGEYFYDFSKIRDEIVA